MGYCKIIFVCSAPLDFYNKKGENNMIKVNVNELRKVAVEYRADVNIWDIAKEAEQLYNAIKLVGIENVVTTYLKNDFSEEEKIGLESSKRIRAVAAYFMMN